MTRISDAIDRLLIDESSSIKTRIEELAFNIQIQNTNSKIYCYCLKVDANGNLRLKDLVDYIDDRIIDYAIPRKEREDAHQHYIDTKSSSKISALKKKASMLFTDLKKTGEGGEVLLYLLAQELLKLPQLLCKMSLKTSGKMHYQGADGIHFKFNEETKCVDLYWGESKMYSSISTAMTKCLESIKGFLLDPMSATSVQERDISLVTRNLSDNITCPEVEDFLVDYFDKDKEQSNSLAYKGICFIGFDSEKYPQVPMKETIEEIKEIFHGDVAGWIQQFNNALSGHSDLTLKELHVFLIPFPSVQEFRDYYLEEIH